MVSLFVMLMLAIAMIAYMARLADQPAKQDSSIEESQPAASVPLQTRDEDLVTAVDHDRIATFEDHVRGQNIDRDSYYYLLDLARNNPANKVRQSARQDVSFAMLLDDPEKFRGEPLVLRGRLRRLIQYQAAKNEQGIPIQYEGWLYTADSGQFPYTLILADAPIDIATGTSIHVNVEVVGYFLGWWRYDTADGKPTSSPFIMVSSIRRLDPSLAAASPKFSSATFIALLVATVALAIAATAWMYVRAGGARSSSTPSVDSASLSFTELEDQLSPIDPSKAHANGSGHGPASSRHHAHEPPNDSPT